MVDQPEGRLGALARKPLVVAVGITIAAIGYLDLWPAGSERSIGKRLVERRSGLRASDCRRAEGLAQPVGAD